MSISIDNTYLTQYSTDAATEAAAKVTGTIQNASTDEEMLDACKQFEAYMLQQMFKNMEEASKILTEDEEDQDGQEYLDMFSDTYLEELSNRMVFSGQGLGVAEKLYESIKANSGETVSAEAVSGAAATASDAPAS